MNDRKTGVKTYLDSETLSRLDACCKKQSRSRSNVLVAALKPYLSKSGYPTPKTGESDLPVQASGIQGD